MPLTSLCQSPTWPLPNRGHTALPFQPLVEEPRDLTTFKVLCYPFVEGAAIQNMNTI